MRHATRELGTWLVGAILCVPVLTSAAGVGEPWEGQRSGMGTWLSHTAGAAQEWQRPRLPRASAGAVLEHRRTSSRYRPQPESYLALKGGGLRVGDDAATDGVFLGFEVGGALERVFEVGFCVDYYYRHTENLLVLGESNITQLPLQVVASDATSAHLLPLGLTLRVRLPLGDSLSPFLSTTLAYEMLFLENLQAGLGDPWLAALAQDETFTGFGVQTAAGLGVRLAPTVGLFAEAGYHWGTPSQGYVVNGVPVELQVNMDGPFLRGGLRFGL